MVRIVILAAGKGKRMGNPNLPKVLTPFSGRPLLSHVLDAVAESGVDAKPVIVVGHRAEDVMRVCGDGCEYARQERLRGTGDAVRSARSLLEEKAEHVLVLNGDHPLVTGRLIRRLADTHLAAGAVLTMGTVTVPDFDDWRRPFADFGRVERDKDGRLHGIVEAKDASPAQLSLLEINPNLFCIKADWLWPQLKTLTSGNAQGEYYLTDLAAKAGAAGDDIRTVVVPPEEAVGINTPEQLALAERLLQRRHS